MKSIFVLSILIIGTSIGRADQEEPSIYVKHTLSRYYLGSVGADFSDGHPSLSSEVTVSKGDFYVGLWMATGPGHAKYKEDWDPYIGFVHRHSCIRYEATVTYFVLSDLAHMDDDLWVIDQKVSLTTMHAIQPYMKVRAFNKVGSRSFESGWFGWVGLEYKRPIGKSMLRTDLSLAESDGPFGKTPGSVYYRAVLSYSYNLTKTVTITPSFVYQVPTGRQQSARVPFVTKNQFLWGISVGYPIQNRR